MKRTSSKKKTRPGFFKRSINKIRPYTVFAKKKQLSASEKKQLLKDQRYITRYLNSLEKEKKSTRHLLRGI